MLDIFGDAALLRAACRFEAALARAQAVEGLLTVEDAEAIAQVCEQPGIEVEKIAREAAHAGTLAIPLVRHLREQLADQTRADKLHMGATSQDLADTALMLQARDASALLEADLRTICDNLASLATRHASTPLLGRTLLQGALPTTFGLRAAQWLLGAHAARIRLAREGTLAFQLQLGGAVGTLAGLNGKGLKVAQRMAHDLGLGCSLLPWHVRRDSIAGLGTALAIVCGALAKIARDVSLMSQNGIAEASEPLSHGRGGSSAMPHKRNPTGCQVALSAAVRAPQLAATLLAAMPQEEERGLGGWQAEAPGLADLYAITHGAIRALLPVTADLTIDTAKMLENMRAVGVGADTGEAEALVQRALHHYRDNG